MKARNGIFLVTTVVVIAIAVGLLYPQFKVDAQSTTAPNYYEFSVPTSSTMANCAPITGLTTFCFTGDGSIAVSVNGAAFKPYAPASSTAVTQVTINGTTKQGPTPSFTISGTVSPGSVTIGAPTVTAGSLTVAAN